MTREELAFVIAKRLWIPMGRRLGRTLESMSDQAQGMYLAQGHDVIKDIEAAGIEFPFDGEDLLAPAKPPAKDAKK